MDKNKIKEMQDRATRRRDGVFSMWPYTLIAVYKNNIVWFSEFIWPDEYWVYQLSYWFSTKVWEAKNKTDARNKLEYLIFNIEN